MGRIFKTRYASRYNRKAPGWTEYDLLFGSVSILALRNLNAIAGSKANHTTLSWLDDTIAGSGNRGRFDTAVVTTCELLKPWAAFRGSNPGKVMRCCRKHLPSLIGSLCADLRKRDVSTADRLRPGDPTYATTVARLAQTVAAVSRLKREPTSSPMFGSKILHFFIPEIFPVWDWEFIRNRCLKNETRYRRALPKDIKIILGRDKPALEYACYLHLMLSDRAHTTKTELGRIRKTVVGRAREGDGLSEIGTVLDYHYARLTPTLFEICLLGKWVNTSKPDYPPE